MLGLAATFSAGVGAMFLAEAGSSLWLLPAIPAPGFLLVTGVSVWRAAVGEAQHPEEEINRLADQRCAQIAAHLSERSSPASVEELMTEMGWSEEAVVDGLDAGVRQHRIEEDLDLDTGHWHYVASSPDVADPPTRKALPVGERAAQLRDRSTN
jgi:hypothetical protein